jgi:hypothetical protein
MCNAGAELLNILDLPQRRLMCILSLLVSGEHVNVSFGFERVQEATYG